jgi:hypothetical protein
MIERYDWINGTYDIMKNKKRLLIDDVIEILCALDEATDHLRKILGCRGDPSQPLRMLDAK